MKKITTSCLALLFSVQLLFAQAGNALSFDGANDQVTAALPPLFSNLATNDFTFEAWVYPTGAIFSRIIYAQSSTTNFATMSTGAANQIYFYVVANGTNYSQVTTATLPGNQWTHVACRWTAATTSVQVFLNGVLQATGGGGGSSTGTSGLMTLGTRPGGAQYFPGYLDEVRVWGTARTQCEIASNMNRHFTGPQTSLLAYYDFDHGTPGGTNTGITTLTDYGSAGTYNGTLLNFALTGATSNWITSTANVTASGNSVSGITTSVAAAVCAGGSYTFPDGSTQTNISSQVVQNSVFPGPGGCDTTIVTTLSVNPTYQLSDSATVCSGGSHTFHDGTVLNGITSSVQYTSTLVSSNGCDSLILTTVTALAPPSSNDTAWICFGGSYQFPDSSIVTNVTQAMSYTSVLPGPNGCDSLVVTQLEIGQITALTDTASICAGADYTFHDGSTQTNITAATMHTSFLTSAHGCDSTITTLVDVIAVDTSVTFGTASFDTLFANASNASFQWIDCNDLTAIPGQTANFITRPFLGLYMVEVTQNGCIDTSACYPLLYEGVGDDLSAGFQLYPNPNAGSFSLELGLIAGEEYQVEAINAQGQVVYQSTLASGIKHPIDLGKVAAGVYLLRVHSERESRTLRLVVEE